LNTSIINDFNSDETKIFSVSEINNIVKELLQSQLPSIWVKGEISNFVAATSGHWYFTLKDINAQVKCTMFKGKNSKVEWQPKNGDSIEARCRVAIYEPRGDYQLNIESLQQSGLGQLFEEFNRLKIKLREEGLFSDNQKKSIPKYIQSIGIITSKDGAVIKDIISTLKRRNKLIKIIIYPTSVQGEYAVEGINKAIKTANQRAEVDALIIARGGGSIEDLWSFNDETVARSITLSNIPTISAVGHETDITICDFVADLRAPTPTAAAELISLDLDNINESLKNTELNLLNIMQHKINQIYQKIDYIEKCLISPVEKILAQKKLVENISQKINTSIKSTLREYENKISLIRKNLNLLNPSEILSRGYSIIFNKNKEIINKASGIKVNDKIHIKLYKGEVEAEISKTKKDNS